MRRRYIVKVPNPAKEADFRFLEWSESIGSPTTYGMTLADLKEYTAEFLLHDGFEALEERLEHILKTGHSLADTDEPLSSLLAGNKAGLDEEEITLADIWRLYCGRPHK